MSVESLAIVLHHSKATGTDKLVLIGIANHDGDGGAWPSVATLARYANVEPRTVQKTLSRLVASGELSRDIMGGGTARTPDWSRPNRYELLISCPPECDKSKNHRLIKTASLPGVLADTPCPSGHPPGVTADTPPVSQRTPEPSYNQPFNTDKSPSVSTSPERGRYCWACGKVHNGKGKYCTSCSSRGLDNPLIECKCGVVRRRTSPGQQSFVCKDCKAANDEGKGAP